MYFIILCGFFSVLEVAGSSHWVTTEDGRIQAQVDSIFHMRRPYDLMALLQQEERFELIESLKQDLVAQKEEIDKNEDKETDLEEKIYSTDEDCLKADQPLPEYDLYISTVLRLDSVGVREDEYVDRKISQSCKEYKVPDCSSVLKLDFSLHAFEHLKAVSERWNLSMGSEIGLVTVLLDHGSVDKMGHAITVALEKNQTSWVLYNMATYFWRIRGNAPKAMECVRRAMHLTPRKYKDVPLMNLGNILHRSHYSSEAALVMHAAIDHNHTNPVTHFTLGNVYAVLGDYNRSVACYDNTLKLEPEFDAARKRKHAVICHQKVEQGLEAQHESLQRTLSELRQYQEQHKYWMSQQEKLISEQAPLEGKLESRLHYEEYKIRGSKDGRGQDCFQYQQNGHTFLSCNMRNERHEQRPDHQGELKVMLQSLLSDLESQVESLSEQVAKKSSSKISTSSPGKPDTELSTDTAHHNIESPSNPPVYTSLPDIPEIPAFHPNWPPLEECEDYGGNLPQWSKLMTVFLPPQNKGFNVEAMLGSSIGIPPGASHPLPWYPPICEKLRSTVHIYDFMSSMRDRSTHTTRSPDTNMRDQLLQYGSAGGTSEAEVGQRILSAIKKGTGPGWLLHNMAALYWRAHGNVYNAMECLRHSLSTAPEKYRDIVLVNLASLVYKIGNVDEALTLAKEAFLTNGFEPSTNFILGNLFYAKGELSSAIFHYRRVLRLTPDHEGAHKHLKVLTCYLKYHLSKNHQDIVTTYKTSTSNPPSKNDIGSTSVVCESTKPVIYTDSTEAAPGTMLCTQNTECNQPGDTDCEAVIKCFPAKTGENVVFNQDEAIEFRGNDINTDQCQSSDTAATGTQGGVGSGHAVHVKVGLTDHSADSSNLDDTVTLADPVVSDSELPDVLLKVKHSVSRPPLSVDDCHNAKQLNWKHFTSTWLSVSAKGINLQDYMSVYSGSSSSGMEPVCGEVPVTLLTMDHLAGIKHRHVITSPAEGGLRDALLTVGKFSVKKTADMGNWLAESLQKNSTSWVLSTSASLYWRVQGRADEAITCLRHSLYHAPPHMKDIPLISLANILFGAQLFNSALILGNMALEISPKFVIIHFTMANIYAAKGELDRATSFYESTLTLQNNFSPAKERLHAIQCSFLLLQKAMESQ